MKNLVLALGSASILSLSACSTTPSPRQINTRDVTASQPIPEPIIDRSFAAKPPLCLSEIRPFEFGQSSYGALGLQGVEGITTLQACLDQVNQWIKDEEASRAE